MNRVPPNQTSIDRFFKANEELMNIGTSCSDKLIAAMESFKATFDNVLKTHFVEKGVAEMLAQSFSELEREVSTNVDGIRKICTEGGQWYAFCFGTILGREVEPPLAEEDSGQKAHGASA
jgi:hypothetical protein